MSVLVVAALSARMLAEAAALDGHHVIALDLFGDADTRRAAQRWCPIGAEGALQIDAARLHAVLADLARPVGDAVLGWIPGGGFEGQPELLADAVAPLPLIGTPADAVRRVRDPRAFFAALAAHGIAHPPTRFEPPADPTGWLLKDARGCGGWHIRHAADATAVPPGGSLHWQREMAGTPMSVTFIGDGTRAMLLGFNELIVGPVGARPHVYRGCIGPVAVPPALAQVLADAVGALTAAFGLRGWCSLDFIRGADDAIGVLEVNPRPPASLALYAQPGLVDAHVRACLHGELPLDAAFARHCVAGQRIVYARGPLTIGARSAQHLAGRPDVHDLPCAGARFAAGDPVCSLSAVGDSAAQVRARLAAACVDLFETLEIPS